MPEQPCPQCGRAIGEQELVCPHCGAVQVPQFSNQRLRAELGSAREGPSRAWPALGCAVGLVLGIGITWLLSLLGTRDQDDWIRSRTQGEIVFLLMIAGLIGGLIIRVVRTRSRRRADRDGSSRGV
jgi:hypothetical protein